MKLGKLLGEGKARKVYMHPDDTEKVIKVWKTDQSVVNQNENEWDAWNMVKGTSLEKYFCPCVELSDDKIYLICKRGYKTTLKFIVPTALKFIKNGDINSKNNYAEYNKKAVLIDYGHPGVIKSLKKQLKNNS